MTTGRCAIKVSAERRVSTLPDLIQKKVNCVVREVTVVIKKVFCNYPNKYKSIIVTLVKNFDSLDEPDAQAAMIWMVGEYDERIDNADVTRKHPGEARSAYCHSEAISRETIRNTGASTAGLEFGNVRF